MQEFNAVFEKLIINIVFMLSCLHFQIPSCSSPVTLYSLVNAVKEEKKKKALLFNC